LGVAPAEPPWPRPTTSPAGTGGTTSLRGVRRCRAQAPASTPASRRVVAGPPATNRISPCVEREPAASTARPRKPADGPRPLAGRVSFLFGRRTTARPRSPRGPLIMHGLRLAWRNPLMPRTTAGASAVNGESDKTSFTRAPWARRSALQVRPHPHSLPAFPSREKGAPLRLELVGPASTIRGSSELGLTPSVTKIGGNPVPSNRRARPAPTTPWVPRRRSRSIHSDPGR